VEAGEPVSESEAGASSGQLAFQERLKRLEPKDLLAFPDDAVIPEACTTEIIADPSLGCCSRMRDGCIELGPWLPFYQGYVCGRCLRADQADVRAGHWPFGKDVPS